MNKHIIYYSILVAACAVLEVRCHMLHVWRDEAVAERDRLYRVAIDAQDLAISAKNVGNEWRRRCELLEARLRIHQDELDQSAAKHP